MEGQCIAAIEIAGVCIVGLAFYVLGILYAENFIHAVVTMLAYNVRKGIEQIACNSIEARRVVTDGCIAKALSVAVGVRRLLR